MKNVLLVLAVTWLASCGSNQSGPPQVRAMKALESCDTDGEFFPVGSVFSVGPDKIIGLHVADKESEKSKAFIQCVEAQTGYMVVEP